MEKGLDDLKRSLVLLMCHQLISAIVISCLFVLIVQQNALPLPKPILDSVSTPVLIAGFGAFLFSYLTILSVTLLRSFEDTRQLSKRKGNAEPWMATIGPGAVFLPCLTLMWKNDAAGQRMEGTQRMLYCLPANNKGLSSLSVPINQIKPKAVSAFTDSSGNLRLIYSEDNQYLVIFAYPAPLAKLVMSSSKQIFLPPK